MKSKTAVVLLFGVFILNGSAGAYEEIQVSNGGSIAGKVTLNGPVPEPRVFPTVLYPFGSFCKKISNGAGHILLNEFIVGPGNGMQDTVVAVLNVDHGKAFEPIKADFVAVDCMFHPADVPENEQYHRDEHGDLRHAHPLVAVMQNPQEVSVVNLDPILHNGQVFQKERGNIVLNFPLPISDESFGGTIKLDRGKRITQMICGMHEFMQTWGFSVDNPYYAKTGRDGTFEIDDLPPGTYQVVAWHPNLKQILREVTVKAGKQTSLNFDFNARQVVRPHYESQKKFRIGPEALPEEHWKGCEAPYC
ncbi:MAG TPA: carboxypeptidase-like regulatory domain-containing protein [Nitrospiria bacterium]